MSIDHIFGPEAFARLAPFWDQLAVTGMTNTPFQSLAYQQGWWQHLTPEGASLHTLVQCDGPRARAIACFYAIDGTLYFNGCVEETDYLDLITSAADAALSWQSVVDFLASSHAPAWHTLDLCNIPETSPTLDILPRLAEARGWQAHSELHEVCPVIDLPESFDAYLAQLPKKQRHEIRRKMRRADGAGLTVRHVTGRDPDELHIEVERFLALLAASTPEKAAWLNDGRRALFHDVAGAAARAGTLQLLFTEVNGDAAAALFNFVYDGRVWVYNSGLNPRDFGHLSAGVVLTAVAIAEAIDAGLDTFDFLRGDEQYKYRFGATDTRVMRLVISR